MSKEIQLKNEELQFEALKKSATDMAAQVDKLQVTDSTTQAIAIQNLSLLKATMKQVEDVHKTIKAPYWDACKKIDGLKNALYDPMEESYKKGNKKVLDYQQEVQRKALAEQNRILAIKNAIAKYSNDAIKEMDACTNMDQLREVRERLIVNAPMDKWAEFLPDFEKTILTLNDYAKSCRTKIQTPAQADEAEKEIIAEAIVENNELIGVQEVAETFVPKMKGVRKTWKHQLVDLTLVPLEWLQVNDEAVKNWRIANQDKIKDGDIIDGIKFFQEESLSIR